MLKIHFFALISIIICLIGYLLQNNKFKVPKIPIFLVLLIGFIIRVAIAYNTPGFKYDINTYGAWAEMMYNLGPSNFYSVDVLTDYPPLYMYMLYIVGFIRNFFNLEWLSKTHVLLLKFPSIISDIICIYLIYKSAKNKHDENKAIIFSLIYLFLPVIIINSSSWGQTDSLYALMIVLMCLSLKKEKMFLAYLSYGIGVLLKPQTIIFTPVLLVGIIDNVLVDFNIKKIINNLNYGLLVILGMFIISLPFGIENVIRQYFNTINSVVFASRNAYNFWAMIGMNWVNQNTKVLFFSAKAWGSIAIVLIVIITFFLSYKYNKKSNKYFLLGAFIIFTMFMFSVRMCERYLYPLFILIILALIEKQYNYLWITLTGASVLNYYNTAHTLYFYDPQTYNYNCPFRFSVSIGMLVLYIFFIIGLFSTKDITISFTKIIKPLKPIPSKKKNYIKKIDLIMMISITVFYSFFALYDLGDNKAPETVYNIKQNESIVLEFEEIPNKLIYYIGPAHQRKFNIETENDIQEITLQNVFKWEEVDLTTKENKLVLTLLSDKALIIELCFKKDDKIIKPINYSEYKELFDEEYLVPEEPSFRNSTYFDEIYHARTAYEYINKLPTYERVHPPLGKILISIGVIVFGMNPFGYRIIGTLFGILMLPLIYVFSKKIFNNTLLSSVSTFIFAFDFMHFVQTRISTIDVYVTFFIILMFYFMYEYSTKSFYDTKLKDLFILLGLSSISMALAVSTKWSGAYAGVGIAIIFFMNLFRRYREYLYAKNDLDGHTENISHKYIVDNFKSKTIKIIGFCIVFFVIIPIIMYTLFYIPFVDSNNSHLIKKMIDSQIYIFNYHTNLEATHYFSSLWYEWPIMIKPVWYYSRVVSDTLREGISSFGNPLVWWVGIFAFIFQFYILFNKNISKADKYNTIFILIAYLSGLLPWVLVTRVIFIYHYFPCVPFVVLMIINSFKQIRNNVSSKIFKIFIISYTLCVFALFILFYPVLSGQAVELSFVVKYLRWLPEWFLVSG
ncbi:MAG: phospholipid carrier-dependent glycosyltransferase [Erysipelotrichaceae bacterium]|nr:phospholipid carrier-dependent glycosyltransferase [Erysipelotrichaceae bacterium]